MGVTVKIFTVPSQGNDPTRAVGHAIHSIVYPTNDPTRAVGQAIHNVVHHSMMVTASLYRSDQKALPKYAPIRV